ncbi:MAG: hypothetical protein Pars2KO_10170 [Parasphingorhabdus sp.]
MITSLLLALSAASTEPPMTVEQEIVVIGKRLESISVMVGQTPKGKLTCSVDRTSGSLRLDKRLCKTAAKCVRKNKDNPSDMAIKSCIDKKKPKLLAKLRQEMRSERR